MKKNRKRRDLDYYVLKKTFRMMRLTLFCLLLGIIQIFANDSYSQQASLNLKLNNVKIVDVLNEIENQTEFFFLYNQDLVNVEKKVDVDFKEQKIDQVLKKLFAGSNISYLIQDRQIVLTTVDAPNVSSQQKNVSGKVTDSEGHPLPGVSIIIKGTNTGTITDFDGNFTLTNVSGDATLVFSFVGMKTQEIAIAGQSSLNITMEEDAIGIEEVVAIGYGAIRRKDLTGSVSSVRLTDEITQLPNVSIIQSLQGSVPGLNVGVARKAGEQPSLTIRGYNTLSTSASDNAPLVVVDGIIYRGNLIDLNTNDIESIDILKDASSASIYGSQASNGVILITTKKGKESKKPIFNYSNNFSLQTPHNVFEPMGREELIPYILDANWVNGSRFKPDYLEPNPDFSFLPWLRTLQQVEGYEQGFDHDWWGAFTGNGHVIDHNLSISGKADGIGYFISGGFSDVKGFLKNDNYKRYNARINLDYEINEWLNVGLQSFLTVSDYSGIEPNLTNLFRIQPWTPIYDENGEYYKEQSGWGLNPYLIVQQDDNDKRHNLFGNMYADIKLPFIKGLKYKVNYSHNYNSNVRSFFNPWGANYKGYGFSYNSKTYNWSMDNIVTFDRTFNDVHKLNLTFVYGVEEYTVSSTNASAREFEDSSLGYNRLQAGDPSLFGVSTNAEKENSLYTSGRLIYDFKNKYIITGTIRRDGFSGFGEQRKIGFFPSLALGWVASEESFFNFQSFNYLKLRGSYGSSGRRAVRRYDTRAAVSATPTYTFGDGGSATMGQWISKLGNEYLGWETTTGINLGMDFGFFNSSLRGNLEYYRNNTKDILFNIQLPRMTGFSSIFANIGKVRNWGIEFALTGNIVSSDKVSWKTTVNFSRNRNKIVSILGPDLDGIERDIIGSNLFIGEPQNTIYHYEITGELWQLADAEAGVIPDGFLPGTLKIVDQNDDGIISATDDRKVLGYQDPSYRFGISNTLRYNNFNLYFFINSIQGGKDYYKSRVDPNYNINNYSWITTGNGIKGAWDYWMPENPNSKYRRLDTPPTHEGFHFDQRNFVRLQDVTLSYQFNKALINKLPIEGLKVFISGKNLLTFTKWEGIDPEVNRPIEVSFPVMSSYSIGLNVDL